MGKALHIAKNYLTGKLRCAEFALTNSCVAKCSFCNIWAQKPKIFVDAAKAEQAIDRLAGLGVSHLCFTGGECLLHPKAIGLVETASKRNMHNAVLVAAPQLLLRNDMVKRLKDAGNDLVSISFDSGDPAKMEESRQIPGIMGQMSQAVGQLGKAGLKSMASVLIWKDNYDKLEEVCNAAQNMGFDVVSLNYPTFSESEVYELGGSGIDFPKGDLIYALESAIRLKKAGKARIVNAAASMRNIIDYLKDPSSAKFHCFGGRRVLFVDWFFDAYPCMQLPKPLGNILDIGESALDIPACNKCNMSWYRDFSMYFNGLRSAPAIWESLTSSGGLLM